MSVMLNLFRHLSIKFQKKLKRKYKKSTKQTVVFIYKQQNRLNSFKRVLNRSRNKFGMTLKISAWDFFKLRAKFLIGGFLLAVILIVFPMTVYFWLSELPSPTLLKNREIPLTTKIYDRNGILLYQIYALQNRSFVYLPELPKDLINATISIEDKNYYKHHGVDVSGVVRAVWVDITEGKALQGGSSITQQLIKNALLTSEPTFSRKFKEMVLALWSELVYSKNEILEMYFNQVPYGGTAWGVEAAAETYFGKKVSDLTLAESALLAGLPVAPTLYSPFGARPQLAKVRQRAVLKRMVEDGYITPAQMEKAGKEELRFAKPSIEIKAPHFVMYIKELLSKEYGLKMVEQGGLKVITSLDLKIQEMAQNELELEMENIKNLNVGNGGILVTIPKTGEILAMVGSRDYFDLEKEGNVNVTLALRQPGSSIKPILYALALQKGFTPATLIDDSPISFNLPGQPSYIPVNYDGRYHGRITLRTALANSFNIPAVKLLNVLGVPGMVEIARKMGISTWNEDKRFGLSLALGAGEVTLLDMMKVYGILANNGKTQEISPVLKITDYKGNIIKEAKNTQEEQIVSPEVAFQLSSILADNNARSQAFGLNSSLVIPKQTVAVKTGTTNEKRDNWTIGYNPSFAVGVWVGNNDNSPMNPVLTSGITGAAPIWHRVMVNILKNKPNEPFVKPANLIETKVCAWNGLLPCGGCMTITEYFIRGTEPKYHCQITPTPTPN